MGIQGIIYNMKRYSKKTYLKNQYIMKKILLLFLLSSFLFSCSYVEEEAFSISYKSTIAQRYKNLQHLLGNHILIKHQGDTLGLFINYNRKTKFNLITEEISKDTLFYGTVNKYKGLYYFNEQISDSSYYIAAVDISKNSIKGLFSTTEQMLLLYEMLIDEKVTHKKMNEFVSYSSDSTGIELTPNKKLMHIFYTQILKEIKADTLLNETNTIENETIAKPSEITFTLISSNSENKIISRLYPNPADEYFYLETFKTEETLTASLFNKLGKKVLQKEITSYKLKINCSELTPGVYFLQLKNGKAYAESEKIVIN